MKNGFIALSFLLFTGIFNLTPIYEMSNNNTEYSEWKTIEGDYCYPLTIESEEWLDISNHAMAVERCLIPNDLVEEMTSEELINMIIKFGCQVHQHFKMIVTIQNSVHQRRQGK